MTKAELESMTKDELVEYADDNEIEVQHSWLKDQIISEILKAEKATTKSASAKPDSIKHHEDRKAKIEAENEQLQQVSNELAENQEIANFQGLPQEGETREQLLARIRKLRENPEPTETVLFRSEGLQKEFEAEQKAGREAVAKAEAEKKQYEAALAKAEAGGKK